MGEDQPKKTTAASTGAKFALVLTVIGAVGLMAQNPNPAELVGRLLIGSVVTFFFWWMICTAVVWMWRKIRG